MDLIYYVAMSLDGYIATRSGDVDWLPVPEAEGEDFGFGDFFNSIDALILGRNTYEKVLELGEWHYAGKPCWVMTQQPLTPSQPDVLVTDRSPQEVFAEIRDRGYQRVWLVGGGQLATAFRSAGLITHYAIALIPILLGDGIPLFAPAPVQTPLTLIDQRTFPGGILMLHYIPHEVP